MQGKHKGAEATSEKQSIEEKKHKSIIRPQIIEEKAPDPSIAKEAEKYLHGSESDISGKKCYILHTGRKPLDPW